MPSAQPSPFGRLLRQWRSLRGASQFSLAVDARTSTRHLSFVETGRSQPSREMVLRLAEALDVPLRERNALLAAAGFAPLYRESELDGPALRPLRSMLAFLLERHEPFPAVLVDRCSNVLDANAACARLLARLAGPGPVWRRQPVNVLRLTFDPDGLRPSIVNWDDVGRRLLGNLQREAASAGADDSLTRLVEELLALPGTPAAWRIPDLARAPEPVLALHLKRGDLELRLFSMFTTVGTPQDVTLQELRIESFMPADAATESALRSLSAA